MNLLFLISAAYSSAQEATPIVVLPAINTLNTAIVDAYLEASTLTPQLGEVFELTIHINTLASASIIAWPAFPDEDPVYEIVEAGDLRTQQSGEELQYSQKLQMRIWKTGNFLSPELFVGFDIAGQVQSGLVRSVYFEIPTMLNESDNRNLRPSLLPRGLIYIPTWMWLSLSLFLGLIIFLVIMLIRALTQGMRQASQASPRQQVLAQLQDLKGQTMPASILYPLVSAYIRQYLAERFSLPALEMTTQEIITQLRDYETLTRAQRQGLQQILEQADLVKFAQLEPDSQGNQKFLDYAISWLKSAPQNLESKS